MERTSDFIKELYKKITSAFPANWIQDLLWDSPEHTQDSFKAGIVKIQKAETDVFVAFASVALTGEHLLCDISEVDNLTSIAADVLDDSQCKEKKALQDRFDQFVNSLNEAIKLLKYHSRTSKSQFEIQNTNVEPINVVEISLSSNNKTEWVVMLDELFDTCLFEYRFTYREDLVKRLVISREVLSGYADRTTSKEIEEIVRIAIKKADFLLMKLSHYAKGHRLEYQFNFKTTVVASTSIEDSKYENYRRYLMFIDPEQNITPKDESDWQMEKSAKNAKSWEMVLLMRSYSKKKSLTQAKNLLDEYEKYYEKAIIKPKYGFNNYSLKSTRVYMHNCVLSLKTKLKEKYTYDELIKDMDIIESVQSECFVANYHPYQKAIEFLIESLTNDIKRGTEYKIVSHKWDQLNKWFKQYKKNINWCVENQCYTFQLYFDDCKETISEGGTSLDVFLPSSFSRPLKFKEIQEYRNKLEAKVGRIEYEVDNYQDRLDLKNAIEKVGTLEEKNKQQMGLFVTVTTFLVGLLSIFIGNNGTVSIFDKMQYVIVLGTVLLLFVCVGYFATTSKSENGRSKLFGWLTGFLFVILFAYYFGQIFAKHESKQRPQETQTELVNDTTARFEVIVNKKNAEISMPY